MISYIRWYEAEVTDVSGRVIFIECLPFLKLSKEISLSENIAILSQKGELIALAESLMTTDEITKNKKGIACKTKRVIMKPGTYPKLWTKSESQD